MCGSVFGRFKVNQNRTSKEKLSEKHGNGFVHFGRDLIHKGYPASAQWSSDKRKNRIRN